MNTIKKVARKVLRINTPVTRYVVELQRKNRLAQFEVQDKKVLEVSGGQRPLSKEYLNVDVLDDPEVDVVANLLEGLPFDDDSVDEIVSVATLEHFNTPHVRQVLTEFHRVLKPGGEVVIGVPSLEKIVKQYKKEGCTDKLMRYLHGAQKDEYDIHLFIVDPKRFIEELHGVGFAEGREEEYDFPRHNADYMMKLRAQKPKK